MITPSLALLFLILYLSFAPCSLQAGIEVGTAAVEITPDTSLQMAGYAARKESSRGVLDPLFVRAMILRKDERSVGFVVYDLIDTLGKKINQELTDRIKEKIGLDEVFLIATHTHSGPALRGAENIASLPAFERGLCSKTERVLQEAWESLELVRLGVGRGSVDLNYNRIKELPDGRVKMIWENPKKEPLGPTAGDVYVLKVDNLKGQTKLVLVNYACHPVILGSDNLFYSPDYPGAMCRVLENSHPDRPRCIFINGACGDMNPYFADENDRPAERVQEVGAELAKEVLRVTETIVTEEDTSALSVNWKRSSYRAEGRWNLAAMSSAVGDDNARKSFERLSHKMSDLDLPVSVLIITPEIGFVGLPGEFFSSFQRMLREASPLKHLLVAGYSDGDFGYFPGLNAAVLGGYGANDTATYVRPGAGEHLVIEALVRLNELIGNLRALPSSSDSGYRD